MDGFQRRKEMKKTNILEAALTLFMKYGIQKVAVSEIAKEAKVSQVTIYNYFESKEKLIREVIMYYVEKVWSETEELLDSDIDFSEKIKQIIFQSSTTANEINEDFYQYIMREYATGNNYIEKFYAEKALPRLADFFTFGKEQGYIDSSISNEAIMFYIQMFNDYLSKEEVQKQALPLSEDLSKLLFYGIVGNKDA
ncbi:transcriptional regulator, TetR family [Oceanobacillus limi]|uniref:Transcriptional regulator, TetR family n=1 Tax=Oceanobacillus limi TaxID=930131 RepID=A0A1I0B9G5_9BACI|nr:TetR/AcrR family transcriptional regulator [Oceanobacillus limi]SET02795.1 transcriptional regulator, TetR family [Oceanobacillus limi]